MTTRVAFRSEQEAGRIAVLISRKTIVEADENGLRWFIQRQLFGWNLVTIIMFDVRWDELARVELRGSGDNARLRIIPRNPELFKRNAQIQGAVGQTTAAYRIKSDAEGAVYLTQGQRAQDLYGACIGYLPGTVGDETAGSA